MARTGRFLITCTNCRNEYFGMNGDNCPKCGSYWKNYPDHTDEREWEESDDEETDD